MSPAPRTSWLARLFGNHRPKPVDDVPVDAEVPTALSTRRVGDYLTRRGYHFRIDDDGDITGTWDGNRFWFLLLGDNQEILQVRGRWSTTVPATSRLAVLQAINDWNRERIWPKVYLREESLGLALYAEVSVDLEQGRPTTSWARSCPAGWGPPCSCSTRSDRSSRRSDTATRGPHGSRAGTGAAPRDGPTSPRPPQGRRRLGSPRLTGPRRRSAVRVTVIVPASEPRLLP
ncbi:YbjN domain-containing protein [Oerskovia sp. M15]